MLKKVIVDDSFSDLSRLKRLYVSSFPRNERIPFRWLRTQSQEKELNAYYDQDRLCGLSFLYFTEDLVYLSYLAISKEFRHQGLGSQILRQIVAEYSDRRIVVDIEEVKGNDQVKEKRRDFYCRNGFRQTDIIYHFFGVDYELLAANGKINTTDWQQLTQTIWGFRARNLVISQR